MSIDMPPPAIVRAVDHPANSPVAVFAQSVVDRAAAVAGLKTPKVRRVRAGLTPKEWGCSRACQRMVRKNRKVSRR